jgi:hypothetical protein
MRKSAFAPNKTGALTSSEVTLGTAGATSVINVIYYLYLLLWGGKHFPSNEGGPSVPARFPFWNQNFPLLA